MNLPTLDYDSAESLQASAETRAAVALQAADSPLYFRGLPLKMTVSIKSHFFMLRRLDGAQDNGEDRTQRDAILLIYLCSQDKEKWSEPEVIGKASFQPLRHRPFDWLAAIDEWADSFLTPDDLNAVVEVVDTLWGLHHATQTQPDDDTGTAALGNGQQTPHGNSGSSPASGKSLAAPKKKSVKKPR